jgi:ATP-dependent helicase/nuclease subunit B
MSASLFVHASGAARRGAARAAACEAGPRLVLVGARIEATRALAADLAIDLGALVDAEATTLDRLAAKLAEPALARAGLSIATTLAIDTAAAGAVHALSATLPRMGPLRATPGLPRAIGRTLEELWAADLAAGNVAPFDAELAAVAAHVERTLASEKLVPRSRVLEHAIDAVRSGALTDARVFFLDVAIARRLAGELAQAIARHAAGALFTVPHGDARTLGRLAGLEVGETAAAHGTGALAEALFTAARAKVPEDVLETIVARGEAAEAAEVTRRVLAEARRGTPLHRIAVVLRKPELARASLEATFRGAGIPLAQRRGVRRPDPSGRALIALLTCASEGLSARAFSSYLSFGALPETASGAPPAASANAISRAYDDDDDDGDEELAQPETVRAPRGWERLLVDAAVIGGDPARWRRRLAGLAEELKRRADETDRTGGESHGVRRTIVELAALERFALPLLEDLAALPPRASLASYAERIGAIATRALARPTRALAVLAELAPRASSGEMVTLADLGRVLGPRLGSLESRPLTVGVSVVTPDELRGASFEVVILAGLAERVFPSRVPEDPLLPDGTRRALSPDLEDAHARAQNERLLFTLAVGAAERRVIALASIATAEARARVPSVYFVELLGRSLGRVASGVDVAAAMHRAVSAIAGADVAARPSERTVARVRELAKLPHDEARGMANHLTDRNPLLRSSLARAWRRVQPKLGPSDGLVLSGAQRARKPLAAHEPSARPYSATALESFTSCPLRFHLKSVLRLEPQDDPAPLEMLDPMVRGSIAHEAQFLTLIALKDAGLLPLDEANRHAARATLDEVFTALRRDLVDRLVPAVPHVFHGELDALEADLREWLVRLSEQVRWKPRYFELAFGLPMEAGRDPASRSEPAVLDEGITLRGAIDLVEENVETGALRATDHKTGSNYPIRGGGPLVVRGGQTLQPVLYALALSKLFPGASIDGGRLWYCTSKGEFAERSVPLDDDARSATRELAAAITEALEAGMLPATPLDDKKCEYCDYRLACGPDAWERSKQIPRANVETVLPKLVALRRRP